MREFIKKFKQQRLNSENLVYESFNHPKPYCRNMEEILIDFWFTS